MTENNSDAIGTLRWHGVDGVVIPSDEGYGVIFTADPDRMVITVPYEVTNGITQSMPEEEVKKRLLPMFNRVIHMLDKMGSKDPE